MMQRLARFFPLVLLLLACASCDQSTTTAAAKTQTSKRPGLYIEVSALGNLDYFYDHKLGMKKAGELYHVQTDYAGPADLDMSAMVAALELAIARKPAGIVVVGFEDSLVPVINKAVDSGIPVVTVDADLPRSKRIAFVGTGNFNAGQAGGRKLAELIHGKGQVALLTKLGQSNLEQRIAGYKEALSKFPEIEIVQIANTESDPAKATQIAALLLQRYPKLAGIACVEAAGGAGAATAVKEAGRVGQIQIVAMDRDNAVLKYIENDIIQATVAQQTALMPVYAVGILHQLNQVPIPIANDNAAARITGAPQSIDTGVIVVDKSNCKYFLR